MIVWAVLALGLCGVLPTLTEVVNDFTRCSGFFYKGSQPQGFDQNAQKICQKFENSSYFFASLYSTAKRTPLYSAYTFDYACNNQEGRKTGNWFIEPQVNSLLLPEETLESFVLVDAKMLAKQAVNADYSHTGYDRGHLNPNSYQCGRGRIATFTLTNSAPMDACFNRVHWKEWETAVIRILKDQNPAEHKRIPVQGIFDNDNERDYNRVTVPTHIWTAVCYDHPDDEEESFSFGYIGVNKPDGIIKVKSHTLRGVQIDSIAFHCTASSCPFRCGVKPRCE
uniref:Endonuclease domain-containing 1 protein-like n=1 Tax=Pundamilia nyererei TaxID=303518 RepID=A0A3B4F1C6_9CICH